MPRIERQQPMMTSHLPVPSHPAFENQQITRVKNCAISLRKERTCVRVYLLLGHINELGKKTVHTATIISVSGNSQYQLI